MMWQKITCHACNGKGKSYLNPNEICTPCRKLGPLLELVFSYMFQVRKYCFIFINKEIN